MAGRTLSPASFPLQELRASRVAPAYVAALLLPLVFLHVDYQPTLTLHGLTVSLSDLAVLGIVLLAAAKLRRGAGALRAGRVVWLAAAAFFAWTGLTIVAAGARESWYPVATHLTTGAKYLEYALLAPAVVLLVGTRPTVVALAVSVVGWALVAGGVGVAQFLGAHVAGGWGAGRREPSFLGQHDFAALAGAALAVGFVLVTLAPGGRVRNVLAGAGVVAGVVGVVLSAALYDVAGVLVAVAGVAAVAASRKTLTPRRALVAGTAAVAILAGSLVMRSGDLSNFASFASDNGVQSSTTRVQTYAQRTLLAYIGLRIFADHPLLGVGWEGSANEPAYGPYLSAAHRRFPATPELAFPSPAHPYGIQSAYVQAAADMGAPGLVLLAALLLVPLWLGVRTALRARPEPAAVAAVGSAWTVVAAGAIGGLGLVAGVPSDAVLWLGIGLVATAAAWSARAAA